MIETARELGLAARFFQTNHEGEYVELLHDLPAQRRRGPAEPGRVDALLVGDPRRAGDRRRCRPWRSTSPTDEREPWRQVSVDARPVLACVSGQGVEGYRDALVLLSKELDG